MIPVLLKVKIATQKRPITLYFPVFLVWLLLLAIYILLSPILILTGVLTWKNGPGKTIIFSFPMLMATLWHLKGLLIDVESEKGTLYMSFV